MDHITVDVWLYGPVARYAGEEAGPGYAHLTLDLPPASTVGDLVRRLGIPLEERGITFVNGRLAALPGLDTDLGVVLQHGDRVGISHRRSMWPFQYRFGVQLTPELQEAFRQREDRGIHHAYTVPGEQGR